MIELDRFGNIEALSDESSLIVGQSFTGYLQD